MGCLTIREMAARLDRDVAYLVVASASHAQN